ncbi:MAG: sigma-70 family RNA polymerase sigma factor [Verrucomicrobiia bacterium]
MSADVVSFSSGPEGSQAGGNRPGMAEIFEEEESALLRYAIGLTGRRAVAEDVVQEAFLRLHRHWAEVNEPRAWLFRCVRNLALNERRDRRNEVAGSEGRENAGEDRLPDEELARMETAGLLRMLIAELPGEDRALVEMKFVKELSYAEMARQTGLGVGNVGYRLHHLLKRLAADLRAAGVEGPLG